VGDGQGEGERAGDALRGDAQPRGDVVSW
jgi:hypothetical protein